MSVSPNLSDNSLPQNQENLSRQDETPLRTTFTPSYKNSTGPDYYESNDTVYEAVCLRPDGHHAMQSYQTSLNGIVVLGDEDVEPFLLGMPLGKESEA